MANPNTMNHHLAQNRYFEDEAFIGYLKYLQYWQRPEYIKFIMYPHCLFFLELLQNPAFHNAMAHPANKVKSCLMCYCCFLLHFLIVKVFNKKLAHNYLKIKLTELWKPSEPLTLIDLGNDFYIAKFNNPDNMQKELH
ncbi:uncharacterized protein LOC107863556 [Capsicum annuum]|uniref:uncharacterized protein LOC107863556 n=1 Tax=Capsicum annuum TaxID=4072 RepID=UPI001FB16945|nr:uncharacterized protein LOC107863556 [Capsicum annuum]